MEKAENNQAGETTPTETQPVAVIQNISTQQFIDSALQKYNPVKDALEKLKKDYAGLTIAGTKDKDGYKAVSEAISALTTYRTTVEKTRKQLKDVSLTYGRAIDNEAKDITASLFQIETPLRNKKQLIDEAIADEKAAEARRKAELFKKRTDELFALGFTFNGNAYMLEDMTIETGTIQNSSEEEWSEIGSHIAIKAEAIRERKKSEEAERKRLEEDRKKLAEEMAEFERKKAELAEREAALTAPKVAPVITPPAQASGPRDLQVHPMFQKSEPAKVTVPFDDDDNDERAPFGWNRRKAEAPQVTPDEPTEYVQGHNDALRKVLNILKSPEKFTRETLRQQIENLLIA